jgi:LmbE family N-acetylglucosaminyl deacetylase
MRVLAISPHADDVEIAMGGTIARFVDEGHVVKILTMIIPCETIEGLADSDWKQEREKEQKNAASILGTELEILDINPHEFTFDRENTQLVDNKVREFKPDTVISCWEYDTHQDHKTLSDIVYTATRKNDCSLYQYETMLPGGIGSKAFNPQLFVDVSKYTEKKRKALGVYKSVFKKDLNHLEAIMGRSRYRGEQIGVKYAEAFEVVKHIYK